MRSLFFFTFIRTFVHIYTLRVFYYCMQLFCKDILLILKITSTNMHGYVYFLFDKINEQLTHTGTFGGTFEGNNYAGNHKYIRVNKISLFIKFNKPAHDILFPCMAVCDSMHEFVLSITSHAYTHFVHYSIIYPYVETKDEETRRQTTNPDTLVVSSKNAWPIYYLRTRYVR